MWIKSISKFLETLIEYLAWFIFLAFTVAGLAYPSFFNQDASILVTTSLGVMIGGLTNVIVFGPFSILFNINRNLTEMNERDKLNKN